MLSLIFPPGIYWEFNTDEIASWQKTQLWLLLQIISNLQFHRNISVYNGFKKMKHTYEQSSLDLKSTDNILQAFKNISMLSDREI